MREFFKLYFLGSLKNDYGFDLQPTWRCISVAPYKSNLNCAQSRFDFLRKSGIHASLPQIVRLTLFRIPSEYLTASDISQGVPC